MIRFERHLLPPAELIFRGSTQKFRRHGRRARSVCPFHPRAEHQSFSMDLDRGYITASPATRPVIWSPL
jgi:hypothetical protein